MIAFMKKYFSIDSEEFKTVTVKYCLKIGFYLGLFVGLIVLLNIL